MNRQFRREAQRQERLRQQRAERAIARRQRAREQLRRQREQYRAQRTAQRAQRQPFNWREWLLQPYKPGDLMVLFLLMWVVRWATYQGFQVSPTAPVLNIATAVLITQAVMAMFTLAYIRFITRDGLQWSGPPGRPLKALSLWGGGVGLGALAYGLGWTGEFAATALFGGGAGGVGDGGAPAADPAAAAPGLRPLVDWSLLSSGAGADVLVVVLVLAAFVVLTPLADELIYRRLLTPLFARAGMSDRWLVLFTAFMFALGSAGLLSPARAAVAGIILGYAYTRTGSFGLAVLIHAVTASLTAILG